MDAQTAINTGFGLAGALGGWVLRFLHGAMRDLQRDHRELQEADSELADKVHKIDVLVAGEYVKRDEVRDMFTSLGVKLDRIEHKLDLKVDKPIGSR